jgi:hypothetical protein
MATELALTHDTTIRFESHLDSLEEVEALDESELSVTRTPKSIVLPLFVAAIAGLLAYLQAPHVVEVSQPRHETTPSTLPAKQVFSEAMDEDHWTTAEVAPMPLGLDG